MTRSTGGRAGSGSPRRRGAPAGGSNGASGTSGSTGATAASGANGARAGVGEPSLGALRAEAAALQERADLLTRTGKSVEVRLGKLITSSGGRMTPQIRTLRAAAQETLALLEDTAKRQEAIRQRIAQIEAAAAPPARAVETPPTPAPAPPPARRVAAPIQPKPAPPTPPEVEATMPPPTAAPEVRSETPAVVAPSADAEVSAMAPAVLPTMAPPAAPEETAPAPEPRAPELLVPKPQEPPVAAPAPVPVAPAVEEAAPVAEAPPTPPRPVEVAAPVAASVPAAIEPAVIEPAAIEPAAKEPRIRRQELESLPRRGRLSPEAQRVLKVVGAVVAGVLLLALAALVTPLPNLFGWQVYTVLSGSMEPAIPVGSVVAVQPVPARDLRVGDVITFADQTRPDVRVTHRIVSIEDTGGQRRAVTKGDANNATDSWTVPVDRAIGRVAFHVPTAGYLVHFVSSPTIKMLALMAAALFLIWPTFRKKKPGGRASERVPERRAPATYDNLSNEIESLLTPAGEDSRRPT